MARKNAKSRLPENVLSSLNTTGISRAHYNREIKTILATNNPRYAPTISDWSEVYARDVVAQKERWNGRAFRLANGDIRLADGTEIKRPARQSMSTPTQQYYIPLRIGGLTIEVRSDIAQTVRIG